jgi:hypothetical protein
MSGATQRLYRQVTDVIRTHSGSEALEEAITGLVLDEFESLVVAAVDEALDQTDPSLAEPEERLGYAEAEAAQRWCPYVREVTPLGKGKKDIAIGNRYTTNKDDFTNPAGCRCIASHCMAWRWVSEKCGHCGLAGSPTYPPADGPRHLPNRMPPARAYPAQPDLFDGAAECRPGSADLPPVVAATATETQMPTKNDVFPSKYLKAADLNGRPLTLEIKSAPLEVLNGPDGKQDQKTVLYFTNTPKKMPLNRVNWDAVVDVTGEVDSDNWVGHKIEVYPTTTQMGGKTVDCIRIRTPMVRPSTRSKNKPATKPIADDLNDEIGF